MNIHVYMNIYMYIYIYKYILLYSKYGPALTRPSSNARCS